MDNTLPQYCHLFASMNMHEGCFPKLGEEAEAQEERAEASWRVMRRHHPV
jgi:hypothetical protein